MIIKVRKKNFHKDVDKTKIDNIERHLKALHQAISNSLIEFDSGNLKAIKETKYKDIRGITLFRLFYNLLTRDCFERKLTEEIASCLSKCLLNMTKNYCFYTHRKQSIKLNFHPPSSFYTIKLDPKLIGSNTSKTYTKDIIQTTQKVIVKYLKENGYSFICTPESSIELVNNTPSINPHFHIVISKVKLINGKFEIENRLDRDKLSNLIYNSLNRKVKVSQTHKLSLGEYLEGVPPEYYGLERVLGYCSKPLFSDYITLFKSSQYESKQQIVDSFMSGDLGLDSIYLSGKNKHLNLGDNFKVILEQLATVERLPNRVRYGLFSESTQKDILETLPYAYFIDYHELLVFYFDNCDNLLQKYINPNKHKDIHFYIGEKVREFERKFPTKTRRRIPSFPTDNQKRHLGIK